jgi:hypothetical protein
LLACPARRRTESQLRPLGVAPSESSCYLGRRLPSPALSSETLLA